jgi:hypothetical protein
MNIRKMALVAAVCSVLAYAYPYAYDSTRTLFRLAESGFANIQMLRLTLYDAGQLLAPVAWAVFFVAVFLEAFGRNGIRRRRIASAAAASIMLTASAYIALDARSTVALAADPRVTFHFGLRSFVAAKLLEALACAAWAALFLVFAIGSTPVGRPLTTRLSIALLIFTGVAGLAGTSAALRDIVSGSSATWAGAAEISIRTVAWISLALFLFALIRRSPSGPLESRLTPASR